MRRHGRRPGLVAALLVGSLGSAVAGAGGQVRWFPLFVFGMVLFGAGQSATLQSRYVGADLAAPEQRAKSIAAIVWVGTLGAVFGPIFTPFEKDFARLVGLDELVGPYVFGTHLVPGERGGDVRVPASGSTGRARCHRTRTPSGRGRCARCRRRTA